MVGSGCPLKRRNYRVRSTVVLGAISRRLLLKLSYLILLLKSFKRGNVVSVMFVKLRIEPFREFHNSIAICPANLRDSYVVLGRSKKLETRLRPSIPFLDGFLVD